jgi:hypothetical protein
VFATATYFQDMRLLGVLAVFATILAVLLTRAIAGGMRAFISFVLCHKTSPLSGKFVPRFILKLKTPAVKD